MLVLSSKWQGWCFYIYIYIYMQLLDHLLLQGDKKKKPLSCENHQVDPKKTATAKGKGKITLQGINISHLGKRKIIFKMPFLGDMLVPWRVHPWRLTAGTCPHGGLVQISFLSKWVMAVGSSRWSSRVYREIWSQNLYPILSQLPVENPRMHRSQKVEKNTVDGNQKSGKLTSLSLVIYQFIPVFTGFYTSQVKMMGNTL